MRTEWLEIEQELEDLDGVSMEIFRLRDLANRFYNRCLLKNNNEVDIIHLFEARTLFESCLTVLKGIIEPNDNKLISQVNSNQGSYDIIERYFENLLAILDNEGQKLKDYLESSRLLDKFVLKVAIKSFREKLTDYMNNLILEPFYNTLKYYKYIESRIVLGTMKIGEKEEEIKKKDVFEYMLFREVFISAKIKGSPTRQKMSASGIGSNITTYEKNIHRNVKQSPQIETVNTTPSEVDDEFSDMFVDDEI